jgi:hypothetical protein
MNILLTTITVAISLQCKLEIKQKISFAVAIKGIDPKQPKWRTERLNAGIKPLKPAYQKLWNVGS